MKRPPKRKPGCNYRLCRVCGEEWNVSAQTTEQKYTCPKCRTKKDRKEQQK